MFYVTFNNVSVMHVGTISGLCLTSTKQRIKCLVHEHKTMTTVRLDPQSNALPTELLRSTNNNLCPLNTYNGPYLTLLIKPERRTHYYTKGSNQFAFKPIYA